MTKLSLLPDRHPNQDFFLADIFSDLPVKSDRASMEYPLFTLSTKPDLRDVCYSKDGIKVTIVPSNKGLPTIFDKDILLYCGSLLMAAVNQGNIPPKTIRISSHDLLVTTNRMTDGQGYRLLKKALERLAGCLITTDIKTNNIRQTKGFHLIESYEIVEKSRINKRMIRLEITLSDWFYNSIIGKEVLTINRDYFRLRKPLERRLYELARKYCGRQPAWCVGLENLYKKTGSRSSLTKFRYQVNQLIEANLIPDYHLARDRDTIVFTNKRKTLELEREQVISLKPETYEKARLAAPSYDIYYLESEWKQFWMTTGKPEFKSSPDAAFIGFCKSRAKNNFAN